MSSSKKNIPCSITFTISAISLTLSVMLAIPGYGNADTSPDTSLDTSSNSKPVTNQSTEEQQRAAFSNSTYLYGDAVSLAEYWETTIPEAKLKIGRLLINNNANEIEQSLKHYMGL